ncbi:hypothetical protein [Roseateles chitinivorans]|uniref:hypothetical protein n=1 Tax=Roseateles chitinivorans TaxID=2917965 RepID=UPI003D674A1B
MTREQARDLFAALLDGTVPDLERGAILIAMRIKGKASKNCSGSWRRCRPAPPAWRRPPVPGPSCCPPSTARASKPT